MGRVAIFNIGYGSFQQGFEVSLEIKEEQGQSLVEIAGKLPVNNDIENLYQSWQQSFYRVTGIYRNDASWDIDETIATNIATSDFVTDCWQKVQSLEANMQSWLQPSADINWQKIRERLTQELAIHAPEIRLIIKAREEIVWKLPWHVWDLLSDYPDVGIGYSNNEHSLPPLKQTNHHKVRILAVFGDSKNIDLTEDRQAINNLKHTKPVFLDQPNGRKLIQQLRDNEGWDIFFFAGHSQSETNAGRIYLNETESLTIEQFKNALTEAISKGLKIAIFNSCEGLKLAQKLADLHIPVVIVMQEIVPDLVAQSFLKEFLTEYNSGKPLYTAVCKAQARLEEFTDYPGATWLPLIVQNPTVIPPRWDDFFLASDNLSLQSPEVVPSQAIKPRKNLVSLVIIQSLIVSIIVFGIRWLGILQPLELSAFDFLLQLQPTKEKPDSRILIVTIDEEDIKYQDSQEMKRVGSLSDEALAQALDKLEKLNPTTIALDIYRPNGFDSNISNRIKADNRFFAICKIQEFKNNQYISGVKPPSELLEKQLGFNDVPFDDDYVVRRQFLDMTPANRFDPCSTRISLSYLVSLHYLAQKHNITAPETGNKEWKLGDVVFKKLTNHSSGYHKLDDSGYQILLNYRRGNSLQQVFHNITLKDLLETGIPKNSIAQITEPIILIGTIDTSYKDYHLTPYRKEISGVFLQAQMTSQILSAVLDNRPLLWYWNFGIELIWIWLWSLVAGLLTILISQKRRLIINTIVLLLAIVAICYVVLTYGGWIPLIPTILALLINITILIQQKPSKIKI